MTITAKWVRDPEKFPWSLEVRKGAWEGFRTYVVNTDLEDLVLEAEGLPAIGSSWSAKYPGLKVVSIRPACLGGADTTGTGTGGITRVEVRYAEDGPGAFARPQVDTAYTELDFSTETVLRRETLERFAATANGEDIDPSRSVDSDSLINGGQGVGVQVPRLDARITHFRPINTTLPLASYLALTGKVNAASITLPPVRGTLGRMPMAPGQVLYLGIENPEVSQGLLRVTHKVQLARDWLYRWMRENAKGEAVPPVIIDRVYQSVAFGNLWPAG